MKQLLLASIFLSILVTSCKKDEIGPIDVGYPEPEVIDGKVVMTFHVSKNGNDQNKTQGTQSEPLFTIQEALSRITIRWRNEAHAPDIVRIHVQQGEYTPGNGLSATNIGLAVLLSHYSGNIDKPDIVIEGGFDHNWSPLDFSQPLSNPANQLTVLNGQDELHHVVYFNRPNIRFRGFLIKGGIARNHPLGTTQRLNDYIWKYGGGMFVQLYHNITIDNVYFQDNNSDFDEPGSALMLADLGTEPSVDYQVRVWLGKDQRIDYNSAVNLSNVIVNQYDGGNSIEPRVLSFHIAQNGTDASDRTGTTEAPFQSIQYALDRMLADYNANGLIYDTVRINLQKGIYVRNEGLRNGNIGFYVNDDYKYPNTEKPYIVIEGGYSETWTRPNYEIQQPNPRNVFSVLNGEGLMQHIGVVSREKVQIRGILVEAGNANNAPYGEIEMIDSILENHIWKYGGGMLINLKNKNAFESIYFENNRADFRNYAQSVMLIQSTDPSIHDYSGSFFIAQGQNWGYTVNVVVTRFTFTVY